MDCSGDTLMGSWMRPWTWFFTRLTSESCLRSGMFAWSNPRPPFKAMAIAMRDSVTVSMSAEMMGMFRLSPSLRRVSSWVSRGNTSE